MRFLSRLLFLISFGCVSTLTGCKDTGGAVEGHVASGINDNQNTSPTPSPAASSATWNFLNSADYVYDTNYVAFDGSGASLKTVNTVFNDATTFNRGTHAGTVFSSSKLVLSATPIYELAGTWTPDWSSVVAYWKFNESAGAALSEDSSPSGNSASPTAGVTYGATGKLNSAVTFDGSSGYVAVGSFGNLGSLLSNDVTVGFWFKTSNASTLMYATGVVNSGSKTAYLIGFNQNHSGGNTPGACRVYIRNDNNSAAYNRFNCASYLDGNWHHLVAVTHNSVSVPVVYIDGAVVTPTNSAVGSSGPFSALEYPLHIGAENSRGTTGRYFNGSMDDFAVWSTALTAAQVALIYQTQNGQYTTELSPTWTPKWSNLLGYWKMDGSWVDASGNGRNGTGTNGATHSTGAKIGSHSGDFDGSNDYVDINSTTFLNGATQGSLCWWMKYKSTTVTDGAVYCRFSGTTGQLLWVDASAGISGRVKTISFMPNSSGARVEGSSNIVQANKWDHYCATFKGGGYVRLYKNGQLDQEKAALTTASFINTTNPTYIGGGYGSVDAYLDDFGIWNVALDTSEIGLIYNRQKQKYAGTYDSPIIDMGASGAPWSSLAGVTNLPFYKNIPMSSESDYSSQASNFSADIKALVHLESNVSDSTGNTAALLGSPTYSDGVIGNSLLLKGAGDGLQLSPSANFNKPVNGSITWSAWINFTSTPATNPRAIFSKRNVAVPNEGFEFTQDPTGVINFRVDDGPTSLNMTSNTVFSPGKWYHVLFEIDGSAAYIYVNGKLDKSSTNATYANLISSTSDLYVGYDGRLVASLDDLIAKIDEVAMWSRALSAAEVLELYRRGANRVKYQVRSCIDSSCSCKSFSTAPAGSAADCDGDGIANASDTSDTHAAHWIGPDGTAATYFSELQNNTSVDASGNPTGNVKTTGLTLDWSGSFFTAAARPTANQYFQYRVYLESDDENNLCSGSPCMPDVKSISIGPTRYYGGSPSVVNNTAQAFTTLKSMTRSDSGSCTTYQVSTDGGSTWKWWNGSTWATTAVGVAESNYLSDYSEARLSQLSSGNFKFKAFLNTNTSGDFTSSCALSSLGITYAP